MRRYLRKPRGQGLTEYILVVALVAIAAIGVVTVFGENVRHLFGAATVATAGDTDVRSKAKSGQSQADRKKDLATFGTGNAGNN